MTAIDLAVVIVFLTGLVMIAAWIARRQASTADYYLGDGRLPAWELSLSLAANQVSAISLIGARTSSPSRSIRHPDAAWPWGWWRCSSSSSRCWC